MKTPKQPVPKTESAKKRMQDALRWSDEDMQYRKGDAGKVIKGDEMNDKRPALPKGMKPIRDLERDAKFAKGGLVKKAKKK